MKRSFAGAAGALWVCGALVAFGCSNNEASPSDAGADGPVIEEGGQDASGDARDAETGPLTANQILTNLGVKELSNPPPATYTSSLGSRVTVDPSTWHPLKTREAVFSPRAEIFQAGGYLGGTWNTFFQDALSTPPYAASTPFTDDQSWEQNSAKAMVSADVDGDGLAEAVIFYAASMTDKNLYLRVYSQAKSVGGREIPPSASAPFTVSGVTLSGQSFGGWHALGRNGIGTPESPYFQVTRADLNGDGKQEIVLVDYMTVYLLAVTGPATPGGTPGATVIESKAYTTTVSDVAAGDLDGDGQDELVVCFPTGQYALYDSSFSKPLTNPEITTIGTGGNLVEATFGNFRGNNLAQLALAVVDGAGLVRVHMFDFTPPATQGGVTTITESPTVLTVNDNYLGDMNAGTSDWFRMLPRAVDLQGSGTDELQILGWLFPSPMTATTSSTVWSAFLGVADVTLVDVQVGDIDNDGKQDLVYLSVSDDAAPNLQVLGLNTSGVIARKASLLLHQKYSVGAGFGIAVGNFIDNAARVHYAEHTLKFTDPVVVAVLASPPYWSDVATANPDYANACTGWATTFGSVSTSETDTAHAVGFSVGTEIEFEHDVNVPVFGVTIGKFKASASFKTTTKWEWTTSYQVQKSVQYAAVGGEDNIVFTSVPMDEYRYVIDTSTDPVHNPPGGSLYITIPRAYSTYMVTRDFFNQAIGTGVIAPIDQMVIGHTLGKPPTYPTASQRDALLTGGFSGTGVSITDYENGPMTVAQAPDSAVNSGTTNLTVTITSGSAASISHDFSLDTSVGAGVGDWTVSLTAGFETGYTATSSTSKGTTFGGTVGYLPTSFYTNPHYAYSSGVFAYPYKQANGKSFWVVDYWVSQ